MLVSFGQDPESIPAAGCAGVGEELNQPISTVFSERLETGESSWLSEMFRGMDEKYKMSDDELEKRSSSTQHNSS